MASTADIIGAYIAVDITAADTATTAIIDPIAIMAIAIARMVTTAIVPTDIMAIGETATMAAIGGPIAGTGQAVHIVAGADSRQPYTS